MRFLCEENCSEMLHFDKNFCLKETVSELRNYIEY